MAEPTFAIGDIVAVALALGLLIVLVALRGLTGARVEVKLADTAIAVIPVVLWLLMSGTIKKLVIGSEGITVETAGEAMV